MKIFVCPQISHYLAAEDIPGEKPFSFRFIQADMIRAMPGGGDYFKGMPCAGNTPSDGFPLRRLRPVPDKSLVKMQADIMGVFEKAQCSIRCIYGCIKSALKKVIVADVILMMVGVDDGCDRFPLQSL